MLHRYRRGQGFESRTSLNFFRLSFRNCKSCVYNCDDLHSYNTSDCKTARLGEKHGYERSSEWSGACVKTRRVRPRPVRLTPIASCLENPILKTKQTKKQNKRPIVCWSKHRVLKLKVTKRTSVVGDSEKRQACQSNVEQQVLFTSVTLAVSCLIPVQCYILLDIFLLFLLQAIIHVQQLKDDLQKERDRHDQYMKSTSEKMEKERENVRQACLVEANKLSKRVN